ncbi:MAG: hypothetical protein KDC95_07680 [Planctomycetes bacterium]|nr:hypothetical protein [Planctomycetota bacterium]
MLKLMIAGIATSVLVTLPLVLDDDLRTWGLYIAILPTLQILGLLLVLAGRRVGGAWLVIVGALPMIPAGIPAALGARRMLDEVERERRRIRRSSVVED